MLSRTLRDRADRVPGEIDDLTMLAGVRSRVTRRARRRRVVGGAGAGAGVVAAVVVGTLVIAQSAGDTAGGDGSAAGAGGRPSTSIATKTVTKTGVKVPSRPSPAPLPPTGASLVHVPSAPKPAPLSLGLMPKGWHYVSANGAVTGYGPTGASKSPDLFDGKIVAEVGDLIPGETFPTQIAGRPARVRLGAGPALWIIDIRYSSKILITIQVWPTARLSRAQVIRLADTVHVRGVRHQTHG